MAQAVLEGVAFRMAEVMARMANAIPLTAPISIDGGMSGNPWFCRFLAGALDRSLFVSAEPELTAIGTAQLAAHGAGATLTPPRKGPSVETDPLPQDWHARFRTAREAVQLYGTSNP